LIYLRDVGEVPESPLRWELPNGYEVLRFHYRCIELAKIPIEEFRKLRLVGLSPLLLLTRGGAKREVVEEIIERLDEAKKPGLLLVTELLASLALPGDEDQEWIKWRFSEMFDQLRETKVYKELTKESLQEGLQKGLQEGLQKGLQEGLQKGLQEGELRGGRQVVVDVVRERFPELAPLVQKQVEAVTDAALLRRLIVKMSTASTLQEAVQLLVTLVNDEQKN
jgi:flagellar biosynthesis/type III secretory pathway protein FliH